MNVSIAIAYYNRLEIFKKTLQSIALSKLDKDLYEVVVCDDASNEENKLTSEVFKECGIKNFKLITIKKELKKLACKNNIIDCKRLELPNDETN